MFRLKVLYELELEKALRLIHTYHAVPLPCRVAKGLNCVFPIWFTQCDRVWFTNAMPPVPLPCHASTTPLWKRPLKATAQRGMGAVWAWHGMCELASIVQRRHVGDLPAFGFLWAEFHEGCYQKHTNPLNCTLAVRIFPATTRTFTKDTALSGNDRGAACHVWINAAWQGMAGERHGRGMACAN
jgi:hypothetical protein